jgi:hypothetical protein
MGASKMARTFYIERTIIEPEVRTLNVEVQVLPLHSVEAMPDGPAKKFRLIKMLPADKKEAAKKLSCAEIMAMLQCEQSH